MKQRGAERTNQETSSLAPVGSVPLGFFIIWELIFVDDGSTDSTDTTLDRLAEEDQRVRVIHFKRNMGQTAAMMAGFDQPPDQYRVSR